MSVFSYAFNKSFLYTVVIMVKLNYEIVGLNGKQVVGDSCNLICHLLVYFKAESLH